ncbi:MAG TPA: 6-carboxytetrahydropterin synthase QueD [Ignavibacteriaceae bacterium]|nr:6-carboxytetrahydropterin synthase QueD [Ignavibacteriaceae bacterium]
MRIAKEFRWEMGHRLPEHFGKCKNVHGHSYKIIVELEGELNDQGMILDFYNLKEIVNPIVEKLDHSFLVYKGDEEIIAFLEKLNSKKVIVEFHSTVENIAKYFLDEIAKNKFPANVSSLKVKVFETESVYAEGERRL